jgi:hypothetical protein
MLFTDVSSGRAVNVFKKAGFWILRKGKHIGMTDGSSPERRDTLFHY